MIQASELRIGNWYNEYGIPKKVTAGFIQSLFRIQSFNKLAIDVSPIPLTPEILEKAGFILRGFYYHFPNHDIFKLEQYKLKNSYWLRHNTQSIDSVRINYLHQLQNLYFALTSEELQIDL